jgi:hypothetical protein
VLSKNFNDDGALNAGMGLGGDWEWSWPSPQITRTKKKKKKKKIEKKKKKVFFANWFLPKICLALSPSLN